MRASIATVTLGGSIEQKLEAVAAAGFDAIEMFGADLDDAVPAEVGARAAELGLGVDLYQPLRDFEAVPGELAANLDRAERTFDLMADLGTSTLLVVSSTSPLAVDDDELAAEHLRLLADRAADRAYRVVYEALAWGRHVHDYRRADRIVELAGHPGLGLCLDSFHIFARHDDLAAIRDIPGDRIFALQLADAPRRGDRQLIEWSRHHRCLPPDGSFDLAAMLANVMATGMPGPGRWRSSVTGSRRWTRSPRLSRRAARWPPWPPWPPPRSRSCNPSPIDHARQHRWTSTGSGLHDRRGRRA